MKRRTNNGNKKFVLVLFTIVSTILLFLYLIFTIFNIYKVNMYKDKVLPNSYLQSYALGEYHYDSIEEFIKFLNGIVNESKMILVCNGKEYEYKYSDIGISLDAKKIMNEIKKYQKGLSYRKKIKLINHDTKKVYKFQYSYEEAKIKEFLNNFGGVVNVEKQDGRFVDYGTNVGYVKGINAFTLDVNKSYENIVSAIKKSNKDNLKVELSGTVTEASYNEAYTKVDTLVSSYTTEFNPWQGTRPQNLYTALNYINGAVIEPGEIFSYYKYAGPYNKAGYVFYYEFVGNGVCQIATTVYNAALLGGLEIVKRYPHAKKSVYVPGGLDATVASYSSGWNVDFQFKNTYEYPIYIKAYASNGKATVEFWSNSAAKGGYTYETESVQIGARGYRTYLHVYKDGVEVDKRFIATTWYTEE